MAEYKAPLRDMRFVLNEVFEADKLWSSLAGLQGAVDTETAEAILEECGKIASQVLAPINREGDEVDRDSSGTDTPRRSALAPDRTTCSRPAPFLLPDQPAS